MNSLKRLFSSILPQSWKEEEGDPSENPDGAQNGQRNRNNKARKSTRNPADRQYVIQPRSDMGAQYEQQLTSESNSNYSNKSGSQSDRKIRKIKRRHQHPKAQYLDQLEQQTQLNEEAPCEEGIQRIIPEDSNNFIGKMHQSTYGSTLKPREQYYGGNSGKKQKPKSKKPKLNQHKAASINLDQNEQDHEYGSKGIEEELDESLEEQNYSNEYDEELEFKQHENLVKRQKIDQIQKYHINQDSQIPRHAQNIQKHQAKMMVSTSSAQTVSTKNSSLHHPGLNNKPNGHSQKSSSQAMTQKSQQSSLGEQNMLINDLFNEFDQQFQIDQFQQPIQSLPSLAEKINRQKAQMMSRDRALHQSQSENQNGDRHYYQHEPVNEINEYGVEQSPDQMSFGANSMEQNPQGFIENQNLFAMDHQSNPNDNQLQEMIHPGSGALAASSTVNSQGSLNKTASPQQSQSNHHKSDPYDLLSIAKMKDQLLRHKKAAIQSFKKVEGLTCPICMDLIVSCRIAICGHSFCHQCISECLVRKKDCPQCRKNIRKKVLQQSLMIDNSVKMIVVAKKENGDAEEFLKWQERMKKYQEWINSHKVTSVKAGEKLDVCDTEYIWCKATVELVIKNACRKDLLYLHYEGWNRKYDEYMYIDSHRISPLGLYTNRRDIPVYRMVNGQAGGGSVQMMYAVVLQNAAEEARLAEYERRMVQNNNAVQNQDEDDNDDDDNQNDPAGNDDQGIEDGDDGIEAASSGTDRNDPPAESQNLQNQNDDQQISQQQSTSNVDNNFTNLIDQQRLQPLDQSNQSLQSVSDSVNNQLQSGSSQHQQSEEQSLQNQPQQQPQGSSLIQDDNDPPIAPVQNISQQQSTQSQQNINSNTQPAQQPPSTTMFSEQYKALKQIQDPNDPKNQLNQQSKDKKDGDKKDKDKQ